MQVQFGICSSHRFIRDIETPGSTSLETLAWSYNTETISEKLLAEFPSQYCYVVDLALKPYHLQVATRTNRTRDMIREVNVSSMLVFKDFWQQQLSLKNSFECSPCSRGAFKAAISQQCAQLQ